MRSLGIEYAAGLSNYCGLCSEIAVLNLPGSQLTADDTDDTDQSGFFFRNETYLKKSAVSASSAVN